MPLSLFTILMVFMVLASAQIIINAKMDVLARSLLGRIYRVKFAIKYCTD